jgi:hypothetical protein
MKSRITIMCILLSMLIASSVYAQKIYYWKDKKGVMNATTTPPPDNIKKFETDSWGERDSPQEIQRYQAEQQGRAAQLEQRRQANQAQQEAAKQRNQESTGKSRVDLEKTRLDRKYDSSRDKIPSKWAEDANKVQEQRKKELEKDPDQYFYDKAQRDKEALNNAIREGRTRVP